MLWIKIVFPFIIIVSWSSAALAAEGIQWERFRLLPKISISETYTDNVFLTHEDAQGEYITTVSPELSLDFALAPRNFIRLSYSGDFRFYKEFDNFRKDTHRPQVSWQWTTLKGSRFEVGGRMQLDSFQPFSEGDRSKDFEIREAFADALFRLWTKTELGLRYNFQSRRFDDPRDQEDNFDRNTVAFNIGYRLFPSMAIFLEYSHDQQDNPEAPERDTDANIVYIGARWDPTAKLSGVLKVGYRKTEIQGGDEKGFDTDTDLTYRFSDITEFRVTAFRRLITSTRAARERESGIEEESDFFTSTGGSFSATYKKWEPLRLSMIFSYRNDDFEVRKDSFYIAGLEASYNFGRWLISSLNYQYSRNDSSQKDVDYKENRIVLKLSASI